MSHIPKNDRKQIFGRVRALRERLLEVHYYEESHWLAAAVSFPHLCETSRAQDVLRQAATIAWQFGFPDVSQWINGEVLANVERCAEGDRDAANTTTPLRLPHATDLA